MLVKMKQDQHYIAVSGAKACAFAGDVVDIDPLFAKYIYGKYEVYVEDEEKAGEGEDEEKADEVEDEGEGENNEKPLDRMNKDELIAKAKKLEIALSDEQFAELKKAEIIELIQQVS